MPNAETLYSPSAEGILAPPFDVQHREDEYDSSGFDVLARMQDNHFWYRGRHRSLLNELRRTRRSHEWSTQRRPAVIDLGGGCGGWVNYLATREPSAFSEIALADSSLTALRMAKAAYGETFTYYQTDLMRLGWKNRWDAAFLLDVIEHLPDAGGALRQVRDALTPGGLLFVTVPALQFFWSYNDGLAAHLRRYSRQNMSELAAQSGFRLVRSRYIMFVTSPLLYLARRRRPSGAPMTDAQKRAHIARTHQTPSTPINEMLNAAMALEESLQAWLPYPWGTSLLAVFQKPGN